MTEQQIEWLEKTYPKGFIITIINGNRNVQTYMHNPDNIVGFDELVAVVTEAQQMLSDNLTPVVISQGSQDRWD
jgi:hypothetical protein